MVTLSPTLSSFIIKTQFYSPFRVGLFLRTNFVKSSKSIGKSAQYLYFNVQMNFPLSIISNTNIFIAHPLLVFISVKIRTSFVILHFQLCLLFQVDVVIMGNRKDVHQKLLKVFGEIPAWRTIQVQDSHLLDDAV